ncbi:transcription-repair coupling factor [Panacagrimonas perspica]|uniref:Transcription-repair-coupling factor n=1 Tax=Panacagrimonas perspica TaxID=381431 RepID=A0A4S3KAY7_9GAMM|nr:transcription-repair coupling factor [Panacagrimonas perspica]TDU32427.1 transcription-repair coupling factor [Panacagrimonas perspica]THD05348.1 transcription-repair coupling factor [Panacagrimonas perspica]
MSENALPLPETALALHAVEVALARKSSVLAVAGNEQQAYRIESALRFFASGRIPVLHLPDNETLPYDPFSPHQELLSDRMAALNALPALAQGIVLVTADALIQRLPPRSFLDARSLNIRAGQKLDAHAFRERLVAAGYASVGEVQTQGEFAVRGAIIDLYPMGSNEAYRLDLFDDEIESIRTFDPETQRSTDKVEAVRLLPAREFPIDKEGIETFRRRYREYFPGDPARSRIYAEMSRGFPPAGIEAWLPLFFARTASLTDYLPPDIAVLPLADLSAALAADWAQIDDRFERLRGDIERRLMKPADLFIEPSIALEELESLEQVPPPTIQAQPLPSQGEQIKRHLGATTNRVLFIAESAGRREALLDWLKPQGILPRQHDGWSSFADDKNKYGITLGPLQDGLEFEALGISLVAEPQVFGQRAPVESRKRANKIRDPETILRDLSALAIGSPVVHIQHGVGRYRGLQRLEAGGVEAEYLVLEYAPRSGSKEPDKLYVPVGSLQLIHRYTGSEEQSAPLHSLGTERWGKAQAKAREKANDVAAELLQIQARRAAKQGVAIDIIDDDYKRFCEGFPFTTTADQQKAIDAVLADLSSERPMDRVVCGDVGFGKTEVALRACFAMARAGKQVCVLAPTTLLAQQHEKNFRDRLADWPIRVGAMSRMRTTKEQNASLKELEEGKLDIIIGTHRLLQPDVKFKNLGLVVVDEEHRFGVRHKERLKNLRAEVDLLTLTATPIPRTLNMSLSGLRDMSIIATPPASRIAIKTFVAEWDRNLVIEACQRELRRGGQIYFLHNEVANMEKFARDVQEMVPEGRVRFAHGQMRERELEQVMLDFYHQRFDILVCSTIIESGIDVPTANTILIDRADHLGLAQLHQLRGRVGRSHHRAYAYLLVPSKRALTPDAEKRLEAIETLGDLGSGFALATHDLEIRGAGELLGEDQSGQIEEVGFTMYAELLARAVKAIQRGKLDDAPFGLAACEVDMGVSALIPDSYVPDVHMRLVLYKRASEATDESALDELKIEMIDRFGLLPPQAERLVEAARVRIAGEALGLRKVRAGSRSAVLDFGPEPKIETPRLIRLIQQQPKIYKLEGQKRLHINAMLDPPEGRADQILNLLEALKPKAAPAAP